MDMDAKKQKKQFQNMKICDIFSKLATLFWNPIFFLQMNKKSWYSRQKKTKIMQQFQLKFFKNTLLRLIFYISNETVHFFNISFTETTWNYTKKQSFTETGRKKMGLFGIKLAKRTVSSKWNWKKRKFTMTQNHPVNRVLWFTASNLKIPMLQQLSLF